MYLISVYFDEKTNRTLQRYIARIAEKTGNLFMLEHQVPPHMTISAMEAKNVDVLLPYFQTLEEKLVQGNISIVSVGQLFPYVIYALPVLNEYLSDLSKQIYGVMSGIPETRISKYYQPFSWLPHITLGKTLNKEQMRIAFEILQESFVPLNGKITEIGLAKVNPHEDVCRIKFKNNE